MVSPHSHHPGHDHGHSHAHSHGPAAPHPAQTTTWSILRMPGVARLGAAAMVSVALWVVVWVSMR